MQRLSQGARGKLKLYHNSTAPKARTLLSARLSVNHSANPKRLPSLFRLFFFQCLTAAHRSGAGSVDSGEESAGSVASEEKGAESVSLGKKRRESLSSGVENRVCSTRREERGVGVFRKEGIGVPVFRKEEIRIRVSRGEERRVPVSEKEERRVRGSSGEQLRKLCFLLANFGVDGEPLTDLQRNRSSEES